ncbi:MAG TPA: flagellar assembly protein FliW [Polyangiaceae bacterium]|nr:flagellar assembly protein FliW [Polyangiaceae bacterium]
MKIDTTRFGTLDLPEDARIRFPAGIIGFPDETEMVLLPHGDSPYVAWLQSVKTPGFSLPVVSAHGIGEAFPDVPLVAAAGRAGVGGDAADLAVMAVLTAPKGQPATVNLLAPIVVNSATRTGAQLVLEGSRYTTREVFLARAPTKPPAATTAEAR